LVVTSTVFLAALDAAGLRTPLRERFSVVDSQDLPGLAKASSEMRQLVATMDIPADTRSAILAVREPRRACPRGRALVGHE
jgi:phosphoenolpyruvate synthase/pyruvate phosphate dikinase